LLKKYNPETKSIWIRARNQSQAGKDNQPKFSKEMKNGMQEKIKIMRK